MTIPSYNFLSLYGSYRTNTFSQIFESKTRFQEYYEEVGLGGFTLITTLDKLYVLLYARRGNDPIMSSDQTRFIYDLFSIIFKYGPEYETKLSLQSKISLLTEDEILEGTTLIFNHAENPSTSPTTSNFEPLRKINSQTALGIKKSKIDGFLTLYGSLDSKFHDEFLRRFDRLFNPYPAEFPLTYLLYTNEGDTL